MSPDYDGPPDTEIERRPRRVATAVSEQVQKGLLAIVVAGIVSFLVIDYVQPRSVDFKVGDVASRDIRAPRTLQITDTEATEQERATAVANVRPVFDYDAQAGERLAERVHEAFALGRKALGVAPRPGTPQEGGEAASSGSGDPKAAGGMTAQASPGPQDDTAAAQSPQPSVSSGETPVPEQELDDIRREFMKTLGVELIDVFYQNLLFMRFSPQVEQAIVRIVRDVNRRYILQDKGILPEDMASRGITIVRREGGGEAEFTVYSDRDILDPAETLDLIRKLVQETMATSPKLARDTVFAVTSALIQPNLSYNASMTNARRAKARQDVQPRTHLIKRGTMIVRAGDPIDESKLLLLREIAKAREQYDVVEMFASLGLLALVLISTSYLFASRYIRKYATSMKDLFVQGTILIFVVALARVSVEIADALATRVAAIPVSCYYFAIPVAAGVILVRILMNSETAIVFGVVSSALASFIVEYDALYLVYFFIVGIAAAGGIAHTKERVHVLQGGLVAGVAAVLTVLAIFLVQTRMIDSTVVVGSGYLTYDLVFAFIGGLMSSVLALGVIPFFEMFGYVTDYKLLELANMNHPLLKELMLHAPGTYHHSVIVGSLAEAAAQEIGCNALLARVACYYHDIGKVRKPEYFIENLRNPAENKHDKLSPELSARIIAGHVRDGIEMARQHRLPQPIIDMIPQHQGTALISYFYNKALQQAPEGTEVDENEFRYPGPKPQTREAGIIMLADATEASTRSIKDIDEAKIRANIQRIFQRIVTDGQLDECPLTLKDLARISETFLKVLMGIYHNRIAYPTQYRGAAVPGQGTGAIITLETDSDRLKAAERSLTKNGHHSGSTLWTEEFVVNTTAELDAETTTEPESEQPAVPSADTGKKLGVPAADRDGGK